MIKNCHRQVVPGPSIEFSLRVGLVSIMKRNARPIESSSDLSDMLFHNDKRIRVEGGENYGVNSRNVIGHIGKDCNTFGLAPQGVLL